MLTLRPEEVKAVGAAVGRYRKAVEGLQAEAHTELERFVAGARARREGNK
jgi:Sec-independent protein translocase protein TatA